MPRPTRLGRTHPVIGLTSTVSGGDSGPPGQVPVSNDDGSVSWGSNVSTVSAGGSNLVGPYINLAAGSNVVLTIDQGPGGSSPSNTIRIHATGNSDLRWEAVTDGEDVFVWEDDDLVHEWRLY